MVAPPKLIVTDSQVFNKVYPLKPQASTLTSFSILFARYKGDIEEFVAGAKAIESLTPSSRVLIAEACAHAPKSEDIGRVKLPRMLRRKVGEELKIDIQPMLQWLPKEEFANLIIWMAEQFNLLNAENNA